MLQTHFCSLFVRLLLIYELSPSSLEYSLSVKRRSEVVLLISNRKQEEVRNEQRENFPAAPVSHYSDLPSRMPECRPLQRSPEQNATDLPWLKLAVLRVRLTFLGRDDKAAIERGWLCCGWE